MDAVVTDYRALLARFGLAEFRPGQREVIDAVISGKDVMCVMPTGGGKSLCYQLPSLARGGTTIVVSPLIALMKDQVDTLRQLGIAAKLINSTLSLREQEDVMDEMARGELQMVYVAPERLRNGRFLDVLARTNVTLMAVDEAHCVSEWGHDFRPDYARLGLVRKRYLNGLQTIALTATATPMVRDDVSSLLELQDPAVFVTGFARDNLHFSVSQAKFEAEKDQQLVDFVQKQSGAGIIYAATRKTCELIGKWLPERTERPIGVYHGGMDPEQRRVVQEQFMEGKLDAIVATNAFGMGIDKSDIRYVAHYNLPGTLEAYYQEAGRAGRDGQESECQLFFSYQDRYVQEFFIDSRYPSKDTVKKVYEFLLSRKEDPIELTLEQVRQAIDGDSSEAISTAQTLLVKAGVLRRLDSNQNQMVLRIDSDAATLLDYLPKEAKLRRRVMSAVEQAVGKRRHDDVFVTPKRLMEKADVERDQLMRTLRELSRLNSFDYVPPFRGRAVHFIRRDIPFDQLEIDFDELGRRKSAEYQKLEAVIGFARSGGCRQRVILDYFGDPDSRNCLKCDRCQCSNEHEGGVPAVLKDMDDANVNAFLCGIRVVLSGITRMHGRFGKNLVAQMICGSKNKRISQWKLQRLSTYGMLSSMKQSQLVKVIDALIDHGMADQKEADQRRPTVAINELGRSVMHLKSPLPSSFSLSPALAKALASASKHIESSDVEASGPAANESESEIAVAREGESPQREADSESFEKIGLEDLTNPEEQRRKDLIDALKRYRRRTSAALGIPAYRVLSNSTIDRLAEIQPQSSSELETVSGIGPATMEQHGYDILELIREHLGEQTDSGSEPHSPQVVAAVPSAVPSELSEAGDSGATREADLDDQDAYWTWRLFTDGFSLEEVCQIRKLDRADIAKHLLQASSRGREISPNWLG